VYREEEEGEKYGQGREVQAGLELGVQGGGGGEVRAMLELGVQGGGGDREEEEEVGSTGHARAGCTGRRKRRWRSTGRAKSECTGRVLLKFNKK